MEAKKNLNNIQRKMLDQIYSEEFDKKERSIRNEREEGYKKLEQKTLKDESKSNPTVKKMLAAGEQYFKLLEESKTYLDENGLSVNTTIREIPRLTVAYSYNGNRHANLQRYRDESDRIYRTLAEKKREMRAKIYGLSTSYEEVETEVAALLKGVF